MPNLTDNELRAVAYYALGVSTEGSDMAYQLSFCGKATHQPGVLHPIGNSGYTIGQMQTDLGQRPDVSADLVNFYQEWALSNHRDWLLSDQQKTQFMADLARDGNHIRDPDYDVDNAKYKHEHHGHDMPRNLLPPTGQDIDATFKAHLNTYLATDAGVRFVHQQDVEQVNTLIDAVGTPLRNLDLYRNSSSEDQARIFAVIAKTYNQGPNWSNKIFDDIKTGNIKNLDGISKKIDTFPDGPDHYMRTGRDAALKGAELFNALQNASERNAMREPWQAVVTNPLIDPTTLTQDANRPHLSDQYATVKGAFVQPDQGRGMLDALERDGSYHYGDPANHHSRGFFAQGQDFAQWDRAGTGRAFVSGEWSEFSRDDLSITRNADHTLDLHVKRNGQTQSLLHITHPTGHTHAAHKRRENTADTNVLHQGMHGEDVKKLQTQLGQLGYTVKADSDFGIITCHALERFQHDHHLQVHGKADPRTQQAIADSLQTQQTVTAPAAPAPNRDDPRQPCSPHHAFFNELKQYFPDASEDRLMQFSAACHEKGINSENLKQVYFIESTRIVMFRSGGLLGEQTFIDIKQPAPPAEQSIQQIQQHDQHRANIQSQIDAHNAQVNQQQQGPVMGGR
jgi:hypothetical protein